MPHRRASEYSRPSVATCERQLCGTEKSHPANRSNRSLDAGSARIGADSNVGFREINCIFTRLPKRQHVSEGST
jgi:hypothetical protein